MKKTIILCLSILMIALTGCKKDKNSWGKLAEGAVTVEVGKTVQLNFTHDGNVNPQWASDDETVATVDNNGLVTGVRVGTAYVSVNGLQCKVTVTDKYMNVVEPLQNWTATSEQVMTYMTKMYGNTVIPEIEYDTLYFPNEDSTVWDTLIYVEDIYYEFETSLDEGQFFVGYEYFIQWNSTLEFPCLTSVAVAVDANRKSELPTYLNNRYVEVSKGYYKAYNDWGYISHIYMDDDVVLYSSTKLEDK